VLITWAMAGRRRVRSPSPGKNSSEIQEEKEKKATEAWAQLARLVLFVSAARAPLQAAIQLGVTLQMLLPLPTVKLLTRQDSEMAGQWGQALLAEVEAQDQEYCRRAPATQPPLRTSNSARLGRPAAPLASGSSSGSSSYSPTSEAPPRFSPIKEEEESRGDSWTQPPREEEAPRCECNLPMRHFRSRTQGPNLHRTFYRCPRERGRQCPGFIWTAPPAADPKPVEPRTAVPTIESMTLPPPSRSSRNSARTGRTDGSWIMEGGDPSQEPCRHPETDHRGSNQFYRVLRCKTCKMVLSRERVS